MVLLQYREQQVFFFSFFEYHKLVLIFNESLFTSSQTVDITRNADYKDIPRRYFQFD